MINLMRDLLDLAQIENSAFNLSEEFFSLPQVIESAF
jgi:signal transduction histidine kinase